MARNGHRNLALDTCALDAAQTIVNPGTTLVQLAMNRGGTRCLAEFMAHEAKQEAERAKQAQERGSALLTRGPVLFQTPPDDAPWYTPPTHKPPGTLDKITYFFPNPFVSIAPWFTGKTVH
jgi:hypothetical protein